MHDGAQQRLVTLAMRARTAQAAVQAAVPPNAAELAAQLDALAAEATSALDELSEPARGIHPAFLAEDGLRPALKGLARRSPVPVGLAVRIDERLPEPIEIAAYYLGAETLTNTANHAHASVVHIDLDTADGHTGEGADVLRVCVRHDGRTGAGLAGGSGLVGLNDRVEALSGRPPVGMPTQIRRRRGAGPYWCRLNGLRSVPPAPW